SVGNIPPHTPPSLPVPEVTLVTSANPAVVGRPVTFIATVVAEDPGSGPPTGTVTFFFDGLGFSTVPLDDTQSATLTVATLSVGTHQVSAGYGGDAAFWISGATLTQTIKAATKTTVAGSTNPATRGQEVVLTATVSAVPPGAGVPTGMVTFVDGATVVG